MAVYTSINSKELCDWLERYDFNDFVDFKGISSGVTNSNYLIKMSHSNYILTIFEHNNIEELPFYVDLMTYPAKHNFLCPSPVENMNGESLSLIKNKPALMVSFLKGKENSLRDADSCYLVGEHLAKLHLISNKFPQSNKNTRNLNWMLKMQLKLKKYLSLEDQELLTLEIDYHKKKSMDELPEGIIHGDLFRDNVLFYDNEVSGFIDFYYACNDKFIYDIAIAVNDWCIDEDGKIDKSILESFINGYQSIRKLTDKERKYFKTGLRLAALRFWLSRLKDFYNAKEGEITSIKDPNHFKNILLDRQAMKNNVN